MRRINQFLVLVLIITSCKSETEQCLANTKWKQYYQEVSGQKTKFTVDESPWWLYIGEDYKYRMVRNGINGNGSWSLDSKDLILEPMNNNARERFYVHCSDDLLVLMRTDTNTFETDYFHFNKDFSSIPYD